MKKKIVWIDDDIYRGFLRSYVDELEQNQFTIKKISTVDEIDIVINEESCLSISAIIVDISMPPGKTMKMGVTRGGLITGKTILEKMKANTKLCTTPKVVFTNVEDEEVKQYCKENNIPYLKKEDFLAYQFVEFLSSIINKNREKE